MNISEIVYQETEFLQKLVPFGRIEDVAESLGRIEEAVYKRITELEQSYAAGVEEKCPHTLRRVVIDDLNECVGDLSDRLVEANERIAELEARTENYRYANESKAARIQKMKEQYAEDALKWRQDITELEAKIPKVVRPVFSHSRFDYCFECEFGGLHRLWKFCPNCGAKLNWEEEK